jgi:hypothetical protein
MKIVLLMTLLLANTSFAKECITTSSADEVKEKLEIKSDVPKHLKGAKIIVRLADGRESEVPAEAFKVVPRKQQYIVTKVSQNSTTMCSADPVHNKNRIAVLGGRGAKEGLDKTVRTNEVEIESRVGAVGGVQYQRLITDRISVGGQVQTNKTGLISIGLDF